MVRSESSKLISGFSIVELLVALALTALLLAGVATMFVRTRSFSDVTSADISSEATMKGALVQIADDIRSAGFDGCATPDEEHRNELIHVAPDPRIAVKAYGSPNASYIQNVLGLPKLAPHSQALLIAAIPPGALSSLSKAVGNITEPLQVSRSLPVAEGSWIMVFDCSHRAYFRVTRSASNVIYHDVQFVDDAYLANTNGQSVLFDAGTEAVMIEPVAYYVTQTGAALSLWRKAPGRRSRLLVSKLSKFYLKFGTSSTDEMIGLQEVTDWAAIRSIFISLEAGGITEKTSAKRSFDTVVEIRSRSLQQ